MPINETTEEVLASYTAQIKKRKPRPPNVSFDTSTLEYVFDIIPPPLVDHDKYIQYFGKYIPITNYEFIAPKTLIGIEVEVENVMQIGPNVCRTYWSNKEDGSLRNHGVEFVTPGVMPVSAAGLALNMLKAELNPDIDFSKRTSIHVHLDVRQLTMSQLMGLLFTYVAIENLLFKFVSNNRRNNIFCVPIIETGLLANLRNNQKEILSAIQNYWAKYSALNLIPIQSGSLEFRHMPGTLNTSLLLQWIDLICCLKVFAYKHDLKTIIDQISGLNSNSRYRQFVESVFGTRCVYLDMSNLLHDMEKSVYLIKHSGFNNPFDKFVRGSISQESQLSKKLNVFSRKLTAEQRQALESLCVLSAHTGQPGNMEWVFKSVVGRPNYWKGFGAPYDAQVDIVLQIKKPKRDKQEKWTELLAQTTASPPIFGSQPLQAAENLEQSPQPETDGTFITSSINTVNNWNPDGGQP